MTAVETFWGETVLAGPFSTLEESEESLCQRAETYPDLPELMPTGQYGKVVLDYGCGPGHDTVLLARSGALVTYADVSQKALGITRDRLKLHDLDGKRWKVFDSGVPPLPRRFDHIHCAGVLHHTSNPQQILEAFQRALRPGGECRLMVYDGNRSLHTQSEVPITNWWTRSEVIRMAGKAGFIAEHVGSYECSAPWRPDCYAACYLLC